MQTLVFKNIWKRVWLPEGPARGSPLMAFGQHVVLITQQKEGAVRGTANRWQHHLVGPEESGYTLGCVGPVKREHTSGRRQHRRKPLS